MDPLRPRILRREWKRNKSHLRKADSLPILQLVPLDRPLFLCRRCGFSNASGIPICLWCAWNSVESTRAFEQSIPRGRRISAPPRVFSTVIPSRNGGKEPRVGRDREVRSDHVSVATVMILRALKSKSLGDNYSHTPVCVRHNPSHSVDRNMTTSSISSPSLTNVSHINQNSPMVPMNGSPGRALRRKKNIPFLREKSSRSLRISGSPYPPPERPSTAPAQSKYLAAEPIVAPCPPPVFRLGHPMRPYYNAIRKNMSPCDYNYLSRPISSNLSVSPLPHMSETFWGSDVDLTCRGSPSRGDIPCKFPPTSGCSLSGETELRMALAEQSGNIDGPSSEYRFMKLERGNRRGMRGKVRQLSKDIKDFVLGATPRLQL